MNSHKLVMRHRVPGFLILLTAAVAFLPPVAQAQVYLYGRADFLATTSPGSVIVADFNGDGRPDIAVSDSNNNWVSILLGSANGGFVTGGTYATGSFPTALVAADFNGDKKIDLAVVNANSGTISILLGNGDGTFQSHTDYPVGENPVGIVAADFNSDGKIDLATIATNDSAVAILLGDGDGGFEVQALIPVASGPTLLAGGDVNGDGKIDLITCNNNYSSPAMTVLVSKGDGTFTQVVSQAPAGSTALAVGDFTGNGKLDAVIQVYFGLYLSLGNGDGSFQNPVVISNAPSVNVQGLLVGDFNHDHKLDIALGGVWVLLGNGDGTFRTPILSPAATAPMVAVDINRDGELDLACFTGSNYSYSATVVILLGNGDGTFMDTTSAALASTSYYAGPGVTADFNGDGKLDLAVAESGYPNGQVSVELGKGNGIFGQPIVSALATSGTNLMLTGDFNGDGKSDLVALDGSGTGFEVLMGGGDGTFATPMDTQLNYSINSLAVGDFNKDGKSDVVFTTAYNNSPSVNIYLSNGDGTFTQGAQYVVYPSATVTVADVNGDGNLDLIVISPNYNLLVFLGNGDGTFKDPIFGPSEYYSSQPAIADFNGDGNLDIAVGASGYQSSGIAFLAGNGDGTFAAPVYSDTSFQFSGFLIASDFNGDGKLDLAESSGCCGSSATFIMTGNGDGTFGLPQEYDSNNSSFYGASLIAGDFNSDGVSDLGIPGESSANAPVVFLYLSKPTPNLFPTALTFGTEQVGKTSSPKNVKLTNAGNAMLKISRFTVSGDFLQRNNCGKGLAVGKSCTIQVSFKPTAKGLRTGELSIADNAPGSPQKVHLQGTGK
jgi:hypothetical protein